MNHDELTIRAEKYLVARFGCSFAFRELKACTTYGEIPDAIGWREGASILIECKTSRADFLGDKKKAFRIETDKGMGDHRYYMCPKGLIKKEELPEGWGLLYCHGKKVQVIAGNTPEQNCYWGGVNAPFKGNKEAEVSIMRSALRRVYLNGGLPEIYNKSYNYSGKPKVKDEEDPDTRI